MFVVQHVQIWMDSFHIWHKWSLASEGVLHAMTLTYIFKVIQLWLNMAYFIMSALQHVQFWKDSFCVCLGEAAYRVTHDVEINKLFAFEVRAGDILIAHWSTISSLGLSKQTWMIFFYENTKFSFENMYLKMLSIRLSIFIQTSMRGARVWLKNALTPF